MATPCPDLRPHSSRLLVSTDWQTCQPHTCSGACSGNLGPTQERDTGNWPSRTPKQAPAPTPLLSVPTQPVPAPFPGLQRHPQPCCMYVRDPNATCAHTWGQRSFLSHPSTWEPCPEGSQGRLSGHKDPSALGIRGFYLLTLTVVPKMQVGGCVLIWLPHCAGQLSLVQWAHLHGLILCLIV